MLYLLTGIGLILFVVAVAALIGLVRSGQLDDLDTPPARMLADDVPASQRPAISSQRPAASLQARAEPSPSLGATPLTGTRVRFADALAPQQPAASQEPT